MPNKKKIVNDNPMNKKKIKDNINKIKETNKDNEG